MERIRPDQLRLIFAGTCAKPNTGVASGQPERSCPRGARAAVRQDKYVLFDVGPLSGKSADSTVDISMIEETSVAHHKWEHEMKEHEALGLKNAQGLGI